MVAGTSRTSPGSSSSASSARHSAPSATPASASACGIALAALDVGAQDVAEVAGVVLVLVAQAACDVVGHHRVLGVRQAREPLGQVELAHAGAVRGQPLRGRREGRLPGGVGPVPPRGARDRHRERPVRLLGLLAGGPPLGQHPAEEGEVLRFAREPAERVEVRAERHDAAEVDDAARRLEPEHAAVRRRADHRPGGLRAQRDRDHGAPTAAADPLDEPPGVRDGSAGLRVGPGEK